MSKKGKKKNGRKNVMELILLATAITNLLVELVELISKLLD